jgi:hypothetical protein
MQTLSLKPLPKKPAKVVVHYADNPDIYPVKAIVVDTSAHQKKLEKAMDTEMFFGELNDF